MNIKNFDQFIAESTVLEKSKTLKLKEWGIGSNVELKQLMDYLHNEDINWNQKGQSLKFDSVEDVEKAKEFLSESLILSEGVMNDLHQMASELKDEDKFVRQFFKKYGDKIKKNSNSIKWVKSLYQDTINEKLIEAKLSKIYKTAKNGNYPATIIVVKGGKVIHQETVNTPEIAPASFNVIQNKFPNATVYLEDKTGQKIFSESLVTEDKNIPNSIGIISNKIKDALKILSDKKIKYKPLNKNINGFDVYKLQSGNEVILALTILQKNNIKVLDTERLEESRITEEKAEGDRGPIDDDKIEKALKKKENETGVPVKFLRIIMRRGMAAWQSGHRPGTTQQQWAYARVNSFLNKADGTWGGADKDVAKEVRDGGYNKKLKKA